MTEVEQSENEPATAVARKISLVASLPGKVISNVVDLLKDHGDHVSMLVVCKDWSKAVAESMYRAPPLSTPDSFERLMGLLNTPLPYHPYSAMIRELDITGMAADNLYMGDLDSALGMCPNLEVFRLENCFHISNILIQSIAHHCPNLLQLDLPGCPISDSFIPILTKKCRHLLRLDMSFTNATIASIHPVILNAESLLELDLSECRDSDDLTSLDLSNKGFRRPLKSLNLRNTPITDDLLRYAVSQCPELEIVVLESCPRITDDAVMKLINTCTRLRSLDCSFCDRITDLSLNALTVRGAATGGGSLEELYMSACDLITPRAVQQMVQRNTRLCLLVLDGCEQIMGSFVQELSVTRGDELECSLEEEQLRTLAGLRVEPLELPAVQSNGARGPNTGTATVGGLKFEVTYATDVSLMRRKHNTGYAASAMAAAKEALASAGSPLRGSQGDDYKAGQPPSRRRSSRSLRHRRSLLGLSARQEDDQEDMLEAARFERQEKIREKRRSRTLSVRTPIPDGPHDDSKPKQTTSSPMVAEPLDEEIAAKAAFLAAAAARGMKIAPPGSTPTPREPTSPDTARRSSILKADVPEFVPSQQAQPQGPQQQASWVPPSSTPVRRTSASTSADPWAQQPPSAWSTPASAAAATPRRPSVGQPAGPPSSGVSSAWTTPTGITASSVVAGPGATSPTPAPAASAPEGNTVLLFSGRTSRAGRDSPAPQQSSPEPVAGVDEPAAEMEGPRVLIASGRRRTRGNSISEDVRGATAAAAAAAAASAGAATSPEPSAAQAATWANGAAPGSGAAPWGTDPTAWNNPAQLTSSSSTWASTSVGVVPGVPAVAGVPGTPGFVDPWAKAPGAVGAPVVVPNSSGSSVLGPSSVINTADPWAAPPASSSAGVSMPVTQSAGFAPPSMLSPSTPAVAPAVAQAASAAVAAATASWGPNSSTASTTVPTPATSGWSTSPVPGALPAAVSPAVSAGWGAAQAAAAASASAAAAGSPSRPPRPTSIASGRFGSVGAGAVGSTNANRASWTPGMLASARGNSVTATSVSDGKDAAAGGDAAAAAAAAGGKGEFVFSNPKRGRMLLKLRIETKTGGHQSLSVHEFDDPQQLAAEFVAFWDMHAFKEPLVRLITVRKNNVLRSRAH
ncbi:hypothetical protein HK405_004324 [Cladochytrium tenue]|nr:hypothetical protein HK405_004324 [Cladochytrium tenue]